MIPLTRWVLAHRRLVVVFWLVLTVIGLATAGKATKSFDQRFSVPGREGWQTASRIERIYGTGGENVPLLPVVTLPPGKSVQSPGVLAQLKRIDVASAKAVPGARIASYASTQDQAFVSKDGRTIYSVVYPQVPKSAFGDDTKSAKALRAALHGTTVAGAP